MIDPFEKEFIPNKEIDSEYDLYGWISDGYQKKLNEYKFKKPQKTLLKCRNPIAVSATIQKDKEDKRTDCFHFFRYMNSSFMRRYIDKQGSYNLSTS